MSGTHIKSLKSGQENQNPAQEGKPDPVDVHVGQRMRRRRTLIGLSQEKLGESVGLTFQQIQKYERGANRMGASRLYRLAQVLSVPVAYFFEEMPREISGAAAEGFADQSQASLADTPEGNDPLQRRETLELVRAYYRINDAKQRRKVFELIKSLSMGEGTTT